ncbi:MAG: hypothetical protein IMZ65_03865 [Planctomycetes bacterium]|nr:hypothetical protein [Planctomycetota bacterium]
MSQIPQVPMASAAPLSGRPLGVLEATSLGWRLLMSDFWRLWLVAVLEILIVWGTGTFGFVATLVVLPPMAAGLFFVVARRIEGGTVEVGDLFAAFKDRFAESVVAFLPVWGVSLAVGALLACVLAVFFVLGAGIVGAAGGDEEVAAVTVVLGILAFMGVVAVVSFAVQLTMLLFTFLMPAIWGHPGSGWEAAKASVRLAWSRFFSVLGLAVLFWFIHSAANLLGMCMCCVGLLVTMPAVVVWQMATIGYLYRSWTGRPLTVTALPPVPPPMRSAPLP